MFILNVLTDARAKAFFPREECVLHPAPLSPSSVSSSGTLSFAYRVPFANIKGRETPIVAASTV